jgi:predicted secreted Zn-dependent protease
MPIWTNVGTLCPAIQNEWTDFLSKVSAHEQQHVNFIQTGFADYGDKIIGKTLLQAKAIYDKMAKQVQKDHDSIDPPSIPLNLALDDTPECKQSNKM